MLDALPRPTFGRYTRPVPAFRTCGIVGFYGAVLTLMAVGLLTGGSAVVLAGIATVAGLSFFAWALIRRALAGYESLVLLEHVWVAEACVAAGLWAAGYPVLRYLDVMAVALCVFLAAGRVGCLLVGCCHGRPSGFGIRYGDELIESGFTEHLVGVRLLPVPAFEAVALLAIGSVGVVALPFTRPGSVFTFFLVGYSVVRFGLEGLRGDERAHVVGLSVNRWMCVAEFAAATAISAHEQGTAGPRELALAGLLATLLAVVAARGGPEARRQLLAPEHLAEVQAIASRRNDSGGKAVPNPLSTSRGVRIATTPAADGLPLRHVSVSLATGLDTELLCTLAAHACPGALAESVTISDAGVLHVLVADVAPGRADVELLSKALFGSVARRGQNEAGEVEAPPEETSALRAAYFGA